MLAFFAKAQGASETRLPQIKSAVAALMLCYNI
jgi:hypothetical protein